MTLPEERISGASDTEPKVKLRAAGMARGKTFVGQNHLEVKRAVKAAYPDLSFSEEQEFLETNHGFALVREDGTIGTYFPSRVEAFDYAKKHGLLEEEHPGYTGQLIAENIKKQD